MTKSRHCDAGVRIKGLWRDEIYARTKSGKEELIRVDRGTNILTWDTLTILTQFFQNAVGMGYGVLYHAIGEGDPSWDTDGSLFYPSPQQTTLTNEWGRKTPDGINYIRLGGGVPTEGTINSLKDPWRVNEDDGSMWGRFEADGLFNGMTINFLTGANAGESRTVTSYTQANGEITFAPNVPTPVDTLTQYSFEPLITGTPTNAIEIRTSWNYGDFPGPTSIREQALFGNGATGAPDSGMMIDVIRHQVKELDTNKKIVRYIDLVFSP